MVYPYEFLKMITYAGVPLLQRDFPGANLPNTILTVAADGAYSTAVCCQRQALRPQNEVQCGFRYHPAPPPRSESPSWSGVIILSDPTKRPGFSLAEPECRRVIAALDLAEEAADSRGMAAHLFRCQNRYGNRYGKPRLDRCGPAEDHPDLPRTAVRSTCHRSAVSTWEPSPTGTRKSTMLMHTRGIC